MPKPEKMTVTLNEMTEFKVMRQDLTDKQIEKYHKEFNEKVSKVLQNNDKFDFNSLNRMAMIKKILHDFTGAEKIWLYIVVKRPKNSLAYYNLGTLYMEDLKNNNQAEKAFLMTLENSKGESGNEQYYRAIVTFYTYNYPEKKQQVEKILLQGLGTEQYKNSQTLLSLLATYYQNNNQPQKAIEYWNKVLKIDPGNEGVKSEIERIKSKGKS